MGSRGKEASAMRLGTPSASSSLRKPPLRRQLGRPRWRVRAAAGLALLGLLATTRAHAREGDFRRFPDYLWLLLGAGMGLVVHESGHLLFDAVLGTDPQVVA